MGSQTPLLVGEAPGIYVEGGEPLTGAIGHRIANLVGITEDEYMEWYDRVNLFDREVGEGWPWADARFMATEIKDTLTMGRSVVLLGVRVADAFGMINTGLYQWSGMPGPYAVRAIRVPHPSGRNRLLNEDYHRERFREALLSARKEWDW